MLRIALPVLAGCAAAILSTSAQAQAFDARRCSAIRNVEVPYDIAAEGQTIVFTRGQERITVSDRAIVVGGARLDDPVLAGRYAASLRGFMANSRRLPLVSAAFGQSAGLDRDRARAETPGFLGALKDMCQSLLEVSDIQARVARAFPAFTAPIRVTLAK
ncbi:MAG TPA: hypothetical protein VEA44_04870 [Caulobacter sp.]|nr:hypothetical protein [Caulobacter sp.]